MRISSKCPRMPCFPALRTFSVGQPTLPTVRSRLLSKRAASVQAGTNLEVRRNAVGIQMISKSLHAKLFPGDCEGPERMQEDMAREHLRHWDLLGKELAPLPDPDISLPPLVTGNISEHFQLLGREQSEYYLDRARELAESDLPPMPEVWKSGKAAEGWVRYDTRKPVYTPTRVSAPEGDALIFDTEVLYRISQYPVLAVAASKDSWYAWVAPGLFSHSQTSPFVPHTLIRMGMPDNKRVIVGHHIAYDRARILEEYRLLATEYRYIDTMSMHCALGGLSTQQRPAWMLHQKEKILEEATPISLNTKYQEEVDVRWEDLSSPNSLKNVASLYLEKKIDKADREQFATTDVQDILGNFQALISYCANDVLMTHELFRALLPKFLEKCPHPASFAGMLHMGKGYLPITSAWNDYVQQSESKYNEYQNDICDKLVTLANEALKLTEGEQWKNDPWLSNLDWTVTPVRMTKPKLNTRGEVLEAARPYKAQKAGHGKPHWYAELIPKNEEFPRITLSKRVAPYLLKLKWNGFPLYHTSKCGWAYVVPKDKQYNITVEPLRFGSTPTQANTVYDARASHDDEHYYYRVPHPGGDGKNCGSPLSKSYISAFENGALTSQYDAAKHVLALNAQCTYWTSAKQRIFDQFKCWKDEIDDPTVTAANGKKYGVILPQSVVMGTVTRRAVEATWMTAANAKKNRIGSELKCQVQAPRGYKIVGADVDSEELWIASLLGDSQFKLHGATAIGFMTLQGTKKQGTDLHTVTGNILGISRDSAKVFNYGRIYGAGVKYAIQLLLQHSPGMSREAAEQKAVELYAKTKGQKFQMKGGWSGERDVKTITIWHGGSETFMFNELERIAVSEKPTTPVLQCVIPDSLMPKYVKEKFMTSRVNWAVQSSGVDYLHLLLVSMDYLMRRLKINGRFMISIHDEVRYLVEEQHSLLAAYCLQIANLWVRAAFAASVGIFDVPASAAFFSSVDIDHCLRKEVDMECVTPSNSVPVKPGRSVDIYDIEKELSLDNQKVVWGPELETIKNLVQELQTEKPVQIQVSKPMDRSPKLDKLETELLEYRSDMDKLKLQIQISTKPEDVTMYKQDLTRLDKTCLSLARDIATLRKKLQQQRENPKRTSKESKPRKPRLNDKRADSASEPVPSTPKEPAATNPSSSGSSGSERRSPEVSSQTKLSHAPAEKQRNGPRKPRSSLKAPEKQKPKLEKGYGAVESDYMPADSQQTQPSQTPVEKQQSGALTQPSNSRAPRREQGYGAVEFAYMPPDSPQKKPPQTPADRQQCGKETPRPKVPERQKPKLEKGFGAIETDYMIAYSRQTKPPQTPADRQRNGKGPTRLKVPRAKWKKKSGAVESDHRPANSPQTKPPRAPVDKWRNGAWIPTSSINTHDTTRAKPKKADGAVEVNVMGPEDIRDVHNGAAVAQ